MRLTTTEKTSVKFVSHIPAGLTAKTVTHVKKKKKCRKTIPPPFSLSSTDWGHVWKFSYSLFEWNCVKTTESVFPSSTLPSIKSFLLVCMFLLLYTSKGFGFHMTHPSSTILCLIQHLHVSAAASLSSSPLLSSATVDQLGLSWFQLWPLGPPQACWQER